MQEVEVVIFLEEFKVVLRCLEGRQGLRVDPGILVSWSDPRIEDASLESNFPCHLCFGQVFQDDPVVERNQLQEWIPGKLVLVLQPPSSTFHLRCVDYIFSMRAMLLKPTAPVYLSLPTSWIFSCYMRLF